MAPRSRCATGGSACRSQLPSDSSASVASTSANGAVYRASVYASSARDACPCRSVAPSRTIASLAILTTS